jgi:hypothetical protein
MEYNSRVAVERPPPEQRHRRGSVDNPFYERGTVKTRDGFFGRAAELARTFDRLRVMQSVSVVGGPKVGKSSFLYHLALTAPEQLGAGYTCRYLDLQGVTSGREFFARAVEQLGGSGDTHRDLARAIAGKKVVLCLDEFENAADSADFGADFFNVLRSLAQTGELALVVATQTPLPELSHRSTVRTSPFYNIFVPLPLESFAEDEAREMLAALSARGGRPFTDDEITWVIRVAGTHPWRLQALAWHLFKAVERSEPDRARVKRLYQEEMQPAGRPAEGPAGRRSWLWRGLDALGRLARRLGNALDEAQNVLIGAVIVVAIAVVIVFVVLRITPVAQVLDWLRSVFGG